MNEEDINLETKLIEFRKQKFLENEILEKAKQKMDELEKSKIEQFRKKMKFTYDIFMSSFKYSLPIGLSHMAITHSVLVFPLIHLGIFCARLGKNKTKLEEEVYLKSNTPDIK